MYIPISYNLHLHYKVHVSNYLFPVYIKPIGIRVYLKYMF